MKKKYYITSPLYYVNAAPHIGHSYTQIACDTLSRFLKANGHASFFMTGTDEHGEKIEKASLAAGFAKGEEKKFTDSIAPRFKDLWKKLNIDYDYFIRTTDNLHEDAVRKVLSKLYSSKDIYKETYKGWFCTPCEMFWPFTQAKDGVCPDCKRGLEKLDEENYFFRMGKYQDKLIRLIETGGMTIRPETRKNEILSFLKEPLQDLCISRPKARLGWGIELPFDPDYVAYVWVDALINYIAGIGYASNEKTFKELWPCDMHIIGKDILRHHAVYWPILLMAINEKAPRIIFAHGWWVVGKEKMSKSKGNVVDPNYLIDDRKYSVDALRYFLLSQVKFGWDGAFSEDLFIEKYNSDLANDLGNLLSRTLTMVEKYFEGVTPLVKGQGARVKGPGSKGQGQEAENKEINDEIVRMADNLPEEVKTFMDIEKEGPRPNDQVLSNVVRSGGPDFQGALNSILELINKANKFIEVSAPWNAAKENDKARLAEIMDTLVQVLGVAAALLYPFMPETALKMWSQMGIKKDLTKIDYKKIKWGMVEPGTRINKGAPLFPRIHPHTNCGPGE